MLFIYYPKCSTCQKAKKFLDSHNIKYQEQDIKSNLPLKKFINTSGTLYRQLNLKDKIQKMSDEEIIKLISSNGMLIKRPLLISKNNILTGFKEEEYKRAIENL